VGTPISGNLHMWSSKPESLGGARCKYIRFRLACSKSPRILRKMCCDPQPAKLSKQISYDGFMFFLFLRTVSALDIVLWWRVSLFNLIIPLCLQIWYPEINDSSITFQAHQPEKWITMTGPVSIPAELLESSSHIERNMGITTRIDRTMHDYVQNLLYIYTY
jgi:hypothetical protein